MKRLIIAAALASVTPSIYCAPTFHPYGPNLSYGSVSNGQTVLSDINNPAAPAGKLDSRGDSWSIGVLPHLGMGLEYGDVNNLFDEIDTIQEDIDNAVRSFDGNNSQQTADQVNSAISAANRILPLVEEGGYGKLIASVQTPFTPMAMSGVLGGTLSFDGSFYTTARIGALAEAINFDPAAIETYINDIIEGIDSGPVTLGDVTIDYDPFTNEITYDVRNDSTAVVKAAAVFDFGLGYSRTLFSSRSGTLYGGVKGKYYNVRLIRDIEKVANLQEDSKDFFDNIDKARAITSNGFGVDLGVLWVADQFHIGATVTNLNEPSFKYNDIDLAGMQYTNQRIIDALTADEKFTMQRQLKVEAARYFLPSKNVVLGASFDANAVEDPVGDQYQWANTSIAYITHHWILPGGRLGYRKNLAGSKLSYIEAGLTWLYFNIDVGKALENVEVDGKSYPRGAYVNIGLELSF